LSDCWPQFVTVVSVRCLRSKLRVSPATAATGTLIEFCGLVGTILVDEDGIYDPRHPNDRKRRFDRTFNFCGAWR
jgi:hypothetical protein